MKRILLIMLLALSCLGRNALGGCTADVEGTIGSGDDTKKGFPCGAGCGTRVFRISNAESWYKTTLEIYQKFGNVFEADYTHQYHALTGVNMEYRRHTLPKACPPTYSTNTSNSSYILDRFYGKSWRIPADDWTFYDCKIETIDGVSSNPGYSCSSIPGNGTEPYDDDRGPWEQVPEFSYEVCGQTIYKNIWTRVIADSSNRETWRFTYEYSDDPGYADEHTTKELIGNARRCAEAAMPTTFSGSVKPTASLKLTDDNKKADYTVGKWRLKITGTNAKSKYKITLSWAVYGQSVPPEERIVDGSDEEAWYYPNAQGERIKVTESEDCDYTFIKKLVGATIEPVEKD